jgi:DNA-directed RNA polymerase specialized sigma24 family protein
MTELATETSPPMTSAMASFERVYRANVGAISAYFERRCEDAQEVADLTSETFLEAIRHFSGFDPRRGTVRAWLFGIARPRFARHCEQTARGRALEEPGAGVRVPACVNQVRVATPANGRHWQRRPGR